MYTTVPYMYMYMQSVLLTACTIELSTVPFTKLANDIGLVLIKEGCFHSQQTAMPNLSLLMCIYMYSVPQHKTSRHVQNSVHKRARG